MLGGCFIAYSFWWYVIGYLWILMNIYIDIWLMDPVFEKLIGFKHCVERVDKYW